MKHMINPYMSMKPFKTKPTPDPHFHLKTGGIKYNDLSPEV